jgi:hypothetical protein
MLQFSQEADDALKISVLCLLPNSLLQLGHLPTSTNLRISNPVISSIPLVDYLQIQLGNNLYPHLSL